MSLSTTQHKKHQEHAISIRAEGSQPPEEADQAQGLLTRSLCWWGTAVFQGVRQSPHQPQ